MGQLHRRRRRRDGRDDAREVRRDVGARRRRDRRVARSPPTTRPAPATTSGSGPPTSTPTTRCPEAPWFAPGARWSARRVLVHIIAETSQHAGPRRHHPRVDRRSRRRWADRRLRTGSRIGERASTGRRTWPCRGRARGSSRRRSRRPRCRTPRRTPRPRCRCRAASEPSSPSSIGALGEAHRGDRAGGELGGPRDARRPRAPSAGTTRSTSPIASASSALHLAAAPDQLLGPGRTDQARAAAACPPAPGMIPSRISGWPSRAVSAATRRSHASASSMPAAEREAADRGDHRARDRGERRRTRARNAGTDRPGRGLVAELLDVGAGGERLLRPEDHDGLHRGVVARGRAAASPIAVEHRLRQRVHRRPVEPQRHDAAGTVVASAPGRRSWPDSTAGPPSAVVPSSSAAAACGSSSRAATWATSSSNTLARRTRSPPAPRAGSARSPRSSSRSRASRRRSSRPSCLLERTVLADRVPELVDALAARRDRLHDLRAPRRCGPTRSSISSRSRTVSATPSRSALFTTNRSAISMQPGLVRLHAVAPARVHDHDGGVGGAGDLDLDLADADGLDDDPRLARGVEHARRARRREREPAEVAAGGHRADVDAGVGGVVLHAHAVAEDRAAAERAGRVDGEHADLDVLACGSGRSARR